MRAELEHLANQTAWASVHLSTDTGVSFLLTYDMGLDLDDVKARAAVSSRTIPGWLKANPLLGFMEVSITPRLETFVPEGRGNNARPA